MVKMLIPLILFIALNSCAFDKENILSTFSRGVELYKAGKFHQSMQEFKSLVDKGIESGNIYFNLGNAYFKTGDLAKARLYYERAKKFSPRDTDLAGNLTYLKQKLEDKAEPPEPALFFKIYGFAGFIFSENELAVITLSFYMIVMVLWFIHILTGYYYKWVKWLMVLSVICCVWISSVIVLKRAGGLSPKYAVIIPNEVPVRWGDTDDDKIAFYLHKGTKVIVRQIRENWYLITIGEGKSGWIKKVQAEII